MNDQALEIVDDEETEDNPLEKLGVQDRLFVEEYLVDCDPKEAAVRAGFGVMVARRNAKKLMAKPEVAEAIKWGMQERMERLHITADRVVEEYARVAFSEIGDFVDWNAGAITVRGKGQIPPSKRAAISTITENTARDGSSTITVKLHPKLPALDALARHFGMFNDKLNVEHSVKLSDELGKAREEAVRIEREAMKLSREQEKEALRVIDVTPDEENDEG